MTNESLTTLSFLLEWLSEAGILDTYTAEQSHPDTVNALCDEVTMLMGEINAITSQ